MGGFAEVTAIGLRTTFAPIEAETIGRRHAQGDRVSRGGGDGAVGLVGCGDDEPTTSSGPGGIELVNADTLTVGTNLPAPGFWNGDDPSSINGGYEYGIAKDIARRLGLTKGVKVENVSFDALVAGQAQGFDIALSQVTITEDRRKVVDFSVPYFSSDQGVLVNKGTQVPDLAAAKGLQWGVQQSTTGQTFLDTVVKPAKETTGLRRDHPGLHRAAGQAGRRRPARHRHRPGPGRPARFALRGRRAVRVGRGVRGGPGQGLVPPRA